MRSRKLLVLFLATLLALEGLATLGTAQVDIIPVPASLKTIPVPRPVGIEMFIKDNAAAIALGKALFWDMQVGSDGSTACATCHYQAGADPRTRNQLNPGANGLFQSGRANHLSAATDFPFHSLADFDDRKSTLLRSLDDVTGSQGVHAGLFQRVVLGNAKDAADYSALDPLGFSVGGINVRQGTGRNSPSVVNAVYNVRNFWDGRAARRFNGRNPFGDADTNARVLQVNGLGQLEKVRISIDLASLASQAVGPTLSDVEMSASGRTFMQLGRKMLSVQPLAQQEVKADDSVLGTMAIAGGRGLTVSYADLIRAAFVDSWWNSTEQVDGSLSPVSATTPADQRYSLMEANFSMFWGLAIAAYEATLVSDDSPYDRFREGNATALTKQQQVGMRVFMGFDGGNCLVCHFGPEFTSATVNNLINGPAAAGVMERMVMPDRGVAVYDAGFYNLGVRPTQEDIGVGARTPFGTPLSYTLQEQAKPGSVQNNLLNPPMMPGERFSVNGAFKTPSLRNIDLTGPYMHNGSESRLLDVVRFYERGGNFHDENIWDIAPAHMRQRGLIGHPMRVISLVNFLTALTDDRVRYRRAPFDGPSLVVPNGAQGSETLVSSDPSRPGTALDAPLTIPAVGRLGQTTPLGRYLGLPLFDFTTVPAPDPNRAQLALFASDSIIAGSRLDCDGDIWSNKVVRITSRFPRKFSGDVIAGTSITVSGDSLRLRGNFISKGTVSLVPTTIVDGITAPAIETYMPMVMPTVPTAPTLTLAAKTVSVKTGASAVLNPGRYGTVTLSQGATLQLMPGTYVIDKLSLGIGSILQYDPNGTLDRPVGVHGEMPVTKLETVVVFVNAFDMGRGSIVSNGDARLSTHFKMYFPTVGATLRIGQDSWFHGSILAPGSRVLMNANSTLQGSIYAKTIDMAETARFSAHILPELPAPLAPPGVNPAIAIQAPGGGAADPSLEAGPAFALSQNFPNPFRPTTTIRYALPSRTTVELRVFDVAGRSVKTLARGVMAPGVHSVRWDGTGDDGQPMHSGVYFYRLVAGTRLAQRKMVLID